MLAEIFRQTVRGTFHGQRRTVLQPRQVFRFLLAHAHALDARFDFADARQVLIELLPVSGTDLAAQRQRVVADAIEDAQVAKAPAILEQRVERQRRIDFVRHRRLGVLPRDVRAVGQREVRLVVARHRLFAGEHHARLQRLVADAAGDHLIDRNAGVEDRTSGNRRAGQQAAGLRRVNALAGGVLVEEAVDDVDLLLQRLERRQAQTERHVVAGSFGAPVILVHAVAHEEHGEPLRERRP